MATWLLHYHTRRHSYFEFLATLVRLHSTALQYFMYIYRNIYRRQVFAMLTVATKYCEEYLKKCANAKRNRGQPKDDNA